ncbi:hypothetical protein [Allobaculum sp. Allo2]|nr:hypothetical protein [Allobaculum sp. Allo2]
MSYVNLQKPAEGSRGELSRSITYSGWFMTSRRASGIRRRSGKA